MLKGYKDSLNDAFGQTDKQTSKQSSKQTNNQTVKHIDINEFDWMSENYKKVFFFLIKKDIKRTQVKDICTGTGVAYGSVRNSIDALVNEEYITKPERFRKGMVQGIKYSVNNHIAKRFIKYYKNNTD